MNTPQEHVNHSDPPPARRDIYCPPVLAKAGTFRLDTRGGTVIDREIHYGKKGN